MKPFETLTRRQMLVGASLAAGTSMVNITSLAAQAANKIVTSKEYWVKDGDTRLYLFRKRIASSSPQQVLLLAHGSSVSGVPTYDLQVPGHNDFSMMDVFAKWGFDVWTIDFEGYGRSSRTGGNSDIARSVYDHNLAIAFIQKETAQQRVHLYGESAGALRVGCYAQQYPEKVGRLGLASLSYTGEGSPTLNKCKEQLPFLQSHDRRPRDREMILSIFTRDKAGTYDPAVPKALADMELKLEGSDSVPTGSYVDMTTKLPLLDPAKATRPFLILRGEFDGIATDDDVLQYFRHAATSDRAFQFVPGATHAVGWGNQRHLVWNAFRSFLENVPASG